LKPFDSSVKPDPAILDDPVSYEIKRPSQFLLELKAYFSTMGFVDTLSDSTLNILNHLRGAFQEQIDAEK
jgi:hypothetical protein